MELKDIKRLAYVARIEISDEEAEGLSKDLEATLTYINQVNEISFSDEGLLIPEHRNAFREDVVTTVPGSYTDVLMREVPFKEDGFIKVKKIL